MVELKQMLKKFDLLLFLFFLIFSWWLMNKTFRFDVGNSQFLISRHTLSDTALHLSLARSFSQGFNFPPQLPYFPGPPLSYHYYFDLMVGIFERAGLRIDFAFNGLSALSFAGLLFLIYKFPQMLFGKSKALGFLSVLLLLFPASLTFLDFFKGKAFNLSLFSDLWRLPDYIHKGPFDNSIISLLFTLNVFLNQRHLVLALAISLAVLYFLVRSLIKSKAYSPKILFFFGFILGLSFRLHALIFFATLLVISLLIFFFKKFRWILPIFLPGLLIMAFQLKEVFSQSLSHPYFNPGFLVEKPLTLQSFATYWWLNLGLSLLTIPLGFLLANNKQKKIFLSFLPLFILPNIFQLGFTIEQNHKLFNYFFIIGNFYSAYFLIKLWGGGLIKKIFAVLFFFFLTISGLINFMPVKNDFLYPVLVAPKNTLMFWIKNETAPNDIFLAKAEMLDPVTLSGRRNYFGNTPYLATYGYDISKRELLAKKFFEVGDLETLTEIRRENIKYIVIPKTTGSDFNYQINLDFLKNNLPVVFSDGDNTIFKL